MKKFLFLSLFIPVLTFPLSLRLPSLWPIKRSVVQRDDSSKARVGVVKVTDLIDLDESANKLYALAKDSKINGILLVIDCSGGGAGEFSVLHDLVKKVTTIKPVVALVKSRALSGGYLVASAADYIIAHNYSDLGHIGVMMRIERFKNPKVTDRVEAELTVDIFTDSELKALYDPFNKALSEKDYDYLKSRMVVYSNHFKSTIAANRGLDINEASRWADAQIFIAQEALDLKLIDQIGTIFDVDEIFMELFTKRDPKKTYPADIEFIV